MEICCFWKDSVTNSTPNKFTRNSEGEGIFKNHKAKNITEISKGTFWVGGEEGLTPKTQK